MIKDSAVFTPSSFILDRKTYTVGLGHDFETLNEALAYFSTKVPIQTKVYSHLESSPPVTLLLKSGYTQDSSIYVDTDLSWIEISAEDSYVPVLPGNLAASWFWEIPAFLMITAGNSPSLNCIFKLIHTERAGVGILCGANGRLNILNGGVEEFALGYISYGGTAFGLNAQLNNNGAAMHIVNSEVSIETINCDGCSAESNAITIDLSTLTARGISLGAGSTAGNGVTLANSGRLVCLWVSGTVGGKMLVMSDNSFAQVEAASGSAGITCNIPAATQTTSGYVQSNSIIYVP